MATIRRRRPRAANFGTDNRARAADVCPAEAFEYEDDVTPAALEQLRAEAERALQQGGRWAVVEGYVGNKETPPLA